MRETVPNDHVTAASVHLMQSPGMPATVFGYEGDGGLGDRLLAAVLSGAKTATSSLVVQYLCGEPLPRVGEQRLLKDHSGQVHGLVETTRVTVTPLDLVGDDVARDEGEGFRDASEWRAAHVHFWREVADHVRRDSGDANWVLRDSEPVVIEWFRVIESAAASDAT